MSVKAQRYTAFWLYTIFALVIPCVLVLERFNFFSHPTKYNLGIGAVIIICFVAFYFRHHLASWIEELDPCLLKYFLQAVKELAPLLIAYAIFAFLKVQFINIAFIMKWSCLSNGIALGIRVWHLNCVEKDKHPKEVEESGNSN